MNDQMGYNDDKDSEENNRAFLPQCRDLIKATTHVSPSIKHIDYCFLHASAIQSCIFILLEAAIALMMDHAHRFFPPALTQLNAICQTDLFK